MRISDWSSDVCSSDLNDTHALAIARRIVASLNRPKSTVLELRAPQEPHYDPAELYGLIPRDLRQPYEVREVIARLVDGSAFEEFKALYGQTLLCGFAHLWGYPVGILANNGIPFSDSALHGAPLLEICSELGLPLVFRQNIPSFL